MKIIVFFFLIFCLVLTLVVGSFVIYWDYIRNADLFEKVKYAFANPWQVEGKTFCHKDYHICISNEPGWTPEFPRSFFESENLLVFHRPIAHESDKKRSVIVGLRFDSALTKDGYRSIDPLSLLQMGIRGLRIPSFKYRELTSATVVSLNGIKAGKIELALVGVNNAPAAMMETHDIPLMNRNYEVTYFADINLFEQNKNEALQIIESFKIKSEF